MNTPTVSYERETPDLRFRDTGHPLLLWLPRPFHSILVVLTVRHVLGLAMGFMVYALLRRRSVPAWGAAPATVPVLFDVRMLQLENAVLSDTWFIFPVVCAVVTLMWRPRRPRPFLRAARLRCRRSLHSVEPYAGFLRAAGGAGRLSGSGAGPHADPAPRTPTRGR